MVTEYKPRQVSLREVKGRLKEKYEETSQKIKNEIIGAKNIRLAIKFVREMSVHATKGL